MPELSPLETALLRLHRAPEDADARLTLHSELAQAEVVVWLDGPAAPGRIAPRVFDLADGPVVLAFTDEGRLAGFAGAGVEYAALPGRVLAGLLAGQGLSLLINPDDPAAQMLGPQALDWLTRTLNAPAPAARLDLPRSLAVPDLPADVLSALVALLERRLSGVPGLETAVLARAHWADGVQTHVLALTGVPPAGHDPLSRAVAEALSLGNTGVAALDVLFPAPAAMDRFLQVGRRLAPRPARPPETAQTPGAAPGMDPTRPPRLR